MSMHRIGLTVLVLTTVFSRLLYLGMYPAGGANAFWVRLPSALCGILSVFFLYLLVKKTTQRESTAYFSALALAVMPAALEQSRIASLYSIVLCLGLFGVLIAQYVQHTLFKIMVVVITLFSVVFLLKNDLVFNPTLALPTALNNIFKLQSFEFLFFANDSHWLWGLRKIGFMLPFMVIPFLLGIKKILLKLSWNSFSWIGVYLTILIGSVFNTTFPEQRFFYFAIPFLAFILGLGFEELINFLKLNSILRFLATGTVLLLIYDYVLFFHYYTTHYTNRIQSEIPYEKRDI